MVNLIFSGKLPFIDINTLGALFKVEVLWKISAGRVTELVDYSKLKNYEAYEPRIGK